LSIPIGDTLLREFNIRQTDVVDKKEIRRDLKLFYSIAHRQSGSGYDAPLIDNLMRDYPNPERYPIILNAIGKEFTLLRCQLLAIPK